MPVKEVQNSPLLWLSTRKEEGAGNPSLEVFKIPKHSRVDAFTNTNSTDYKPQSYPDPFNDPPTPNPVIVILPYLSLCFSFSWALTAQFTVIYWTLIQPNSGHSFCLRLQLFCGTFSSVWRLSIDWEWHFNRQTLIHTWRWVRPAPVTSPHLLHTRRKYLNYVLSLTK